MSPASIDPTSKRLRLVARILSLPILAITLVMLIGHVFFPEPMVEDYPPIENLLPIIILVSALGLAVAWKWEVLGGALSLAFFVAHLGVFWAIRGEFFPLGMLALFSPLPLTAILFLLSGLRSRGA